MSSVLIENGIGADEERRKRKKDRGKVERKWGGELNEMEDDGDDGKTETMKDVKKKIAGGKEGRKKK